MNETYKTRDLILASYLKLKGYTPTLFRDEEGMGIFCFPEEVKTKAQEFYGNEGSFKEFHDTIRNFKQQVKSL